MCQCISDRFEEAGMPEKRHRPEEITSKLREADVLIRRRFPALLPPPIHLSPISVVFAQCCVSLTIMSLPPRDSGPNRHEIQWICNGAKYAFNFRVRKAWRQPNLLIWRGGGSHDPMVNFDCRSDRLCYCRRYPHHRPEGKTCPWSSPSVCRYSFTMRVG